MSILALFLAQVAIYAAFPFYLASLKDSRRAASFYVYLGILLLLSGFLGSLYSLPLSASLMISGGNLAYGALLMTTVLLVIIERNLRAVRYVIQLVITVTIFTFLLFFFSNLVLNNDTVIKPFGVAAGIFILSLHIMILGGILIILELMILLFIFERIKQRVTNVFLVSSLYALCFVFVLCLDGVFFPAIAFGVDPQLVVVVIGGVGGKLVMALAYSLPMLLFLLVYRSNLTEFIERPLTLKELLKAPKEKLVAEIERQRYSLALSEEQLRVYAQRLALATDSAGIGIWDWDMKPNILVWDERCYELYGVPPGDSGLVFASWEKSVHPDDRAAALCEVQEAIAGVKEFHTQFRVLWPDGQTRTLEAHALVQRGADGSPQHMIGVNWDITQRKQVEAEIRQHAAQMEALDKISQTLAGAGLQVQSVLDTIVRHAADTIGDCCIMSLLSSDEQWLEPVAYHHSNPEAKELMASLFKRTPMSARNQWAALVLSSGQPFLLPILAQEETRRLILPEFLPYFEQIGMNSLLLIPLRVEGKVIGIVLLIRDKPGRPYTVDDQTFMVQLADRAALTFHNAQLFEQINGAHERLQVLSRRVLEVQEAERRHTARELHDEIGQVLTSLKLLLDMSVRAPVETLLSRLGEAQSLVNELMERVDELSLNLRPQMLDDLGLLPTLLWHFEHYTYQTNIQVTFKHTGLEGRRFSPEIETTAYRLIQEALTNVARHAGVSEVTVLISVGEESLGMEIEDRGVGFDPLAMRASTGLAGMHERVALLNGQLTIESSPGSGVYIQAQLPLTVPATRSDEHDKYRFGR